MRSLDDDVMEELVARETVEEGAAGVCGDSAKGSLMEDEGASFGGSSVEENRLSSGEDEDEGMERGDGSCGDDMRMEKRRRRFVVFSNEIRVDSAPSLPK